MNEAQKIAHAQEVMDRLNDRFHDAMEEAMEAYPEGIPLSLLALFFGVQVGQICKKHPEFQQMVSSQITAQTQKPWKVS